MFLFVIPPFFLYLINRVAVLFGDSLLRAGAVFTTYVLFIVSIS